ncbi:DNA cytosine methyltransferase [Actinomadura fibrosa]|uniref:DNA cytosine methyltransferase n=1 Tax=Actinomadura fibrosa TaxID=111802 RepID=A0ABW2XRP5_9ACTN
MVDGRGVRHLMPVEYERLMGPPDDWTRYSAGGWKQGGTARYRQVGNALAVPVATWVRAGLPWLTPRSLTGRREPASGRRPGRFLSASGPLLVGVRAASGLDVERGRRTLRHCPGSRFLT